MLPPPPRSTLFPYTTLFRSSCTSSAVPPRNGWRRWRSSLNTAAGRHSGSDSPARSEEHTSELQSRRDLVCRLLLEKKKELDKFNGFGWVLGRDRNPQSYLD